jgi:OmpA-OmpF porin, OOP family
VTRRPRPWRGAIALATLAAVALSGCAGAELEGKASALRAVIQAARDNGAYRCAPRELALAEAHTEFAEQDLSEGNYYRAKEELAIADRNARAAIKLSPREKCNPGVAIAQQELVVTVSDRDGDGIPDDVDLCPDEPEDFDGFQDEDGCPDPDNDGDGIPDHLDKCPNVFAQTPDGCPYPDTDGDGIPDHLDMCPTEYAKTPDGCPDTDGDGIPDHLDKCPTEYAKTPDGCPVKYELIVVTKEKIELKQTIFFDLNKATIRSVSHALLNEVAAALRDNPTIRVRIEGHTDSSGSLRRNMKLSQDRADAVRAYLVAQGIDRERMETRGFGPSVAIADNRTQEGRDQNRRVEFVIISQ